MRPTPEEIELDKSQRCETNDNCVFQVKVASKSMVRIKHQKHWKFTKRIFPVERPQAEKPASGGVHEACSVDDVKGLGSFAGI